MNKVLPNVNKIIDFILRVFVFILIVDPTNSIFKIKDIIFFILVISSIIHFSGFSIIFFKIVIIVYLIVILSFMFGIIAHYEYDYNFTIGIFKGFSPLVLLLWVKKFEISEKLVFPSIVVSIIVISSFLAYLYNPILMQILYNFYRSHDDTMIMGMRTFLGIDLMAFFYKTSPVLIIPASIYIYKIFNRGATFMDFIIVFLFASTLFLSGTRASMLAVTVIIGINFLLWLKESKVGKFLFVPIITISIISIFTLFFALISEKDEKSIEIKYSYFDSYSSLIGKNPLIILFGQGAGSKFLSTLSKEKIVQTEWSYFEMIRMFGLIGASGIIFLFFYPLYIMYKKRKVLENATPIFIGYFIYLIVGGTNPLLIGSSGMLVLLASYSYAYNTAYISIK